MPADETAFEEDAELLEAEAGCDADDGPDEDGTIAAVELDALDCKVFDVAALDAAALDFEALDAAALDCEALDAAALDCEAADCDAETASDDADDLADVLATLALEED